MPGQVRWFLYDPAQANQGKIDFQRTWGNRTLEDNWRRSSKESRSLDPIAQTTPNPSPSPQANSSAEVAAASSELKKGSPEWESRKEQLKGAVPVSAADYTASERREEEALFKLGKVYRFDLNEPTKAVSTFNRLLADFPKTEYRDEVYYLIYLCLDESDKNKPLWKERLVQEFPESAFTKLLTQSSSPTMAATGLLSGSASQVYERLLSLYLSNNYSEALAQVDNALVQFRGDALEDKFALLRLFLVGKTRGRDLYLKAINEFLKQYPKSTYLGRVQEMLDVNNQTAIRRKN
jgi:outer membrane protein assembly factor BamD (BamD/ComL family)